ncbi:hypothetical protein [Desulfococcus sp.]|uniref:hypothetical protein n=1 Tax=Desulfococcus sp. TaxID=2025834 RepID=UPI0035937257
MTEWVPFENGEYIVLEAFLMTPDHKAAGIEKAYIEVSTGPGGRKRVMGKGLIQPFSIVTLHEEHDAIDLVVDLGGEFKYRLKEPVLKSGKVFSPDINSLVQFFPSRPWEQISREEFHEIRKDLNFLGD